MKLQVLGKENLEKYIFPDDMTQGMANFYSICTCKSYFSSPTQWKEVYSHGEKPLLGCGSTIRRPSFSKPRTME